jgi:hypothetical protein
MGSIQRGLSIITLPSKNFDRRTVIRTTVFLRADVGLLFQFSVSNFTLLVFPSHEHHYNSMPAQIDRRLAAPSLDFNGGEKYTVGQRTPEAD